MELPNKEDLKTLNNEDFRNLLSDVIRMQELDRKENQLLYYQPVSEDAIKIHTAEGTTVAAFGGNGCERAGSRVVTDRGSIPIEQVRVGDKVPQPRGNAGEVIALYTSPTPVNIFRVITKRGYSFTCSGDHLSRIADPAKPKWHNGVNADYKSASWRRIDSLEGTDIEQKKYIKLASTKLVWPDKCDITPNDAWFLGLMVGDGFYGDKKTNSMSLTLHDELDLDLIERAEEYLEKKGVPTHRMNKKGSKAISLQFCNKGLAEWMFGIAGMKKATRDDKEIPESVWRGTPEVVGSFIQGFSDADGCATTKPSVAMVNISHKVLRGIHILLLRLQITASLRFDKTINHLSDKGIWRLEVSGRSLAKYRDMVGFSSKRKQERLPINTAACDWLCDQSLWDRIRSVECIGKDHVYGLTITPKPVYHSDGFLQHNSSKTETNLVELLICATGIIPESLKGIWDYVDITCECEHTFKVKAGEKEYICPECGKKNNGVPSKFRGPIKCRVVVESLTTVLHTIILPKLKWWDWTGVDEPGGEKGHWGWIPKDRLINGSWDKSWSEKIRTLRLKFIDPVSGKEGESSIQFMSHDQDPTDFASGDFHIVMHDEPPSYAIWRENQARTMRVGGKMMLAMTWPDDPAIAVDWIFDEIYDPGTPGPNKNPNISWVNLYTTDNPFLNQDAIATQADQWSDEVKKVRIYGQPIRFSNRVHPDFTDMPQYWCFSCGKSVIPYDGKCGCGDVPEKYCHVTEDPPGSGPVVYILDPHPRKPHMMMWVQVTPYDDLLQVAEASVEGDPVEVKARCDEIEEALHLRVEKRLIDPNMGRSPSGARRGVVWQDEFDNAGLFCDLAEDSDVGRSRLNEFLKPEKFQRRPRFHIRSTCSDTIHQIKRYVWDDYRMKLEKELKQKPKAKNDDFPTMLKYLMNFEPTFSFLNGGAPVIKRAGRR